MEIITDKIFAWLKCWVLILTIIFGLLAIGFQIHKSIGPSIFNYYVNYDCEELRSLLGITKGD